MTDYRDPWSTEPAPSPPVGAIDCLVEAFQRALHAGLRPRLEDYLLQEGGDRSQLMQRLLATELEFRVRSGERPHEDEYLSRFQSEGDLIRHLMRSTFHDPDSTYAGEPDSCPAGQSSPRPLCGRPFGDYELIEEIARGGMGVVFKARQVKARRIVALKMILSGRLADEQDVRRFRAEAGAAAKLDHPNIVPVFDVGQCEGQHYYSMGFVDGPSLRQALQSGPVPPLAAARLLRKIAGAIAYAHSKGVIHRDLKPANVLLDGGENPRVSDFGLAKLLGDDSELTGTGQVMGTPNYMPPEQAAGRTKEVGTSADIYSLGAILYELLTGRPPFVGASGIEVLRQVLEREPEAPRSLNALIDRDLETICLKCLEKRPEARYRTVEELIAELERFIDHLPIASRPITRMERGLRWCRRNPLVAALSSGITALVVTMAIVSPLAYWRQRTLASGLSRALGERSQALQNAERQGQAAEQARGLERRQRLEAQIQLAENYLDRGVGACERSEVDEGLLWMARALDVLPPDERPDLERAIRLSIGAWRPRMHRLIAHRDLRPDVLWTTSSRRRIVAYTRKTGSFQVLDADTGLPSDDRQFAELPPATELVLSVQDLLAIRLPDQIIFYDIARHVQRRLVIPVSSPKDRMIFSPNGRYFAYVDGNVVRVLNVHSGALVQERQLDGPILDLNLSNEEGALATIVHVNDDAVNQSYLWDRGQAHLWEPGQEAALDLAKSANRVLFSPDGKLLVVALRQSGNIQIWDVPTKSPAREFRNPNWGENSQGLQFNATGQSLIARYSGFADVWSVHDLQREGDSLRQGWLLPTAFSRTGDAVASSDDQELRLWRTEPLRQAGQTLRMAARAACISALGGSLVAATEQGTVVWRTARTDDRWIPRRDVPVGMYWTVIASGNEPVAVQINTLSDSRLSGFVSLTDRVWTPALDVNSLTGVASPDGSHWVFIGDESLRGEVRQAARLVACRVATGEVVCEHPLATSAVAIDNQASRMLVWHPEEDQVQLIDGGSGAVEPLLDGAPPLALADTFAFVSIRDRPEERGRFIDISSRRTIASIGSGGAPLLHARLSADERWLATVDQDHVIMVWDTRDGRPLGRAITVPRCDTVQVHADRGLVATSDSQGLVQIWDVETGRPIGPRIQNRGETHGLAFSRDGTSCFTAGSQYFSRRSLPAPATGSAAALIERLEHESGMRLSRDGILRPIDVSTLQAGQSHGADPPDDDQLGNERSQSLRAQGASGFPQSRASVLCDTANLRVSVCANREYLCLQAVLWNEHLPGNAESFAGLSMLALDLDGDGEPTSALDRVYHLNPLPDRKGLAYVVLLEEDATTVLQESGGTGRIEFVADSRDRLTRVDTYLIPWEELGRQQGDYLRCCYWARSRQPHLDWNSAGFPGPAALSSIPRSLYYDLLVEGDTILPAELFRKP